MKRSWPFNLKIPVQEDFRDPSVLLDARDVRVWLDHLPLMRLNVTLDELISATQALNRQKLPYRNRLKVLYEYRQTLLHIYPTSEISVLKRLPVKPEERTHTREEMGRYCRSLADGYRIVLKDAYEAGEEATSTVLLQSLYHSMELLLLELVNHFRCYHAVRPGLYEEIYLLYKIAFQGNITGTPITLEQKFPQEHSIDELLIQGLLLAASDPFRLPQSTALSLFNLIRHYTGFARLYIHESGDLTPHHLLINLNSDLPPVQIQRANEEILQARKLVLDRDTLDRKIIADITQLQTDNKNILDKDTGEKVRLLQLLAPATQEKRVRKAERKEVIRHVKTIFGIDSVFRFLSMGPEELKILLRSDPAEFDSVSAETWVIHNESLTGYMLTRDDASRKEVRVGDILAIHNPEEDSHKHHGRIAVIRWMQQESDTRIQVGVELVPGNIIPAICRTEISGEEETPTFKGIFISSVPALQQPATLLLPKMLYRRGRVLHVMVGDQALTIRANFLREDSFCFDRFDFSSIEN